MPIAWWEVILVMILTPRRRESLKVDSYVYDAVMTATHGIRYDGASTQYRLGE